MSKKQFFVTISMQDERFLKPLFYINDINKEMFTQKCTHPSIPLIGWNAKKGDEIEIISIRTDDDNGRTEKNYSTFQSELSQLSKDLGIELKIDKEIVMSHNESREKQVALFKDVIACFSNDAEIYMDVTYGTKATPVLLFSTLAYAEKINNCTVKSVTYGKYSFNGRDEGTIYDIRCLYEINMLIHSVGEYSPDDVNGLLNSIWG